MKKMLSVLPAMAGLLTLSACGPSLEGTVDGVEFGKVRSAFFRDETPEGSSLHQYRLVVANYEGSCATFDSYIVGQAEPAGDGPFSVVTVLFQLFDPIATETYPILADGQFLPDPYGPPQTVTGRFYTFTDEWLNHNATGGSIQVTTRDAETLAGTISIQFEAGSLSGDFEALPCE